jgi:hypothetical protein
MKNNYGSITTIEMCLANGSTPTIVDEYCFYLFMREPPLHLNLIHCKKHTLEHIRSNSTMSHNQIMMKHKQAQRSLNYHYVRSKQVEFKMGHRIIS